MSEYIFDGEAHRLDKDLGYILKKLDSPLTDIDRDNELYGIYRKYAEYLVEWDKESAIDYIMCEFQRYIDRQISPENTSLIYRPADLISCLATYATLALKFKRAPKDNLDESGL